MLLTIGMRRITISDILLRHSGLMSMSVIIPARRGRLATHLIQRRSPTIWINCSWDISRVVTLIILIRRSSCLISSRIIKIRANMSLTIVSLRGRKRTRRIWSWLSM